MSIAILWYIFVRVEILQRGQEVRLAHKLLGVRPTFLATNGCAEPRQHHQTELSLFRKLVKAVAVRGMRSGAPKETSGKVAGKLLENFSQIAKC